MNIGLLDLLEQPFNRSRTSEIAALIERTQVAESVGFSRYWVAEHHTWLGDSSPFLMLQMLAHRTSHIRLGTGALLVQYYDPQPVADAFAFLTQLHGDRFDLGFCGGKIVDPGRLTGMRAPWPCLDDWAERFQRCMGVSTLSNGASKVLWMGTGGGAIHRAERTRAGYCHSVFHSPQQGDFTSAGIPRGTSFVAIAGFSAETFCTAAVEAANYRNPSVYPNFVGSTEDLVLQLQQFNLNNPNVEIVYCELSQTPSLRLEAIRALGSALEQCGFSMPA